jgi:hypothetical protein
MFGDLELEVGPYFSIHFLPLKTEKIVTLTRLCHLKLQ